MILGSHDTMTYRSPKKWYLKPIKFLARCQSKGYKEQHELYGAESFDLRLFWDKKGNLEFRHGGFAYDATDFADILKYCEDNDIIVRILFENRYFPKYLRKRAKEMNLGKKFCETCQWIEETYPKLRCFGGTSTESGLERYYTFKYDGKFRDIGYYSSVTSIFRSENKILKVIDDWCPMIYAYLYNKKNKERSYEWFKDDDTTIVNFDYIHK